MEDLRRIEGPAKVPQPVDRGTRSQPGHTRKDGFRDVLERERQPAERERQTADPSVESEEPAGHGRLRRDAVAREEHDHHRVLLEGERARALAVGRAPDHREVRPALSAMPSTIAWWSMSMAA